MGIIDFKNCSYFCLNHFDLSIHHFINRFLLKLRFTAVSKGNALFNIDSLKLMSIDVIESRISDTFREKMSLLTQTLSKIDHVSTTTNVISIETKRFLGITVHWIDSDSFVRASHALCFKQFSPPHSTKRLDALVSTINRQFGIQDKIVGSAPSDRTDFMSSFRAIGIDFEENASDLMNDDGVDEDVAECDENTDSIDSEHKDTDAFMLPGQYRCASQLLQSILTTDANQALKMPSYATIFRSSMRKLNQLFRLSKRDEAKDEMKSNHISIEAPVVDQWESLYRAIHSVLQHDLDAINKLMNVFNASPFSGDEFAFLKEYLSITEPIVESLDNLQSNGLYAVLLPTLKTLRDLLSSSDGGSGLKFCAPLAKAIHSGFNDRFKDFFDMTNEKCMSATIAACTHPFFKLRWIDADFMGSNYFNQITDLIISAVQKCNTHFEEANSTPTQSGNFLKYLCETIFNTCKSIFVSFFKKFQ